MWFPKAMGRPLIRSSPGSTTRNGVSTAGFQRFQKGETFFGGLKSGGFAVLFVNGFSHKVGERLEFELKSDFKHAIYCLQYVWDYTDLS